MKETYYDIHIRCIKNDIDTIAKYTKGIYYHHKRRDLNEVRRQIEEIRTLCTSIDHSVGCIEGFDEACEQREQEDEEGVLPP